MSTRAHVCGCVAALTLTLPLTAAAQDRTAREVVDLIVRDSPEARAIQAGVDVTRRDQDARLAYPNPGFTYSRESAGFTEFFQFQQFLPIFGTRDAVGRAGAAARAAVEADRDARLWTLRADAMERVARLIGDQTRLELADSHLRDIERLVEILRIREREGEGSRFDRLRAEQELIDTRQLRTSAAVALADGLAALQALLPSGVTVSRILGGLYQAVEIPPVDLLMTRSALARAEFIALSRAAERTDLEADAARRSRLPAPTLFGGLKRADNGEGTENGAVFGVNVSLPIFDSGSLEAARWTAERTRIEAERASLERRIRADITRAVDTLTLRQALVTADAPGGGEELSAIAEVAYREGEIGILELLDAVRTAARARFRSLEQQLEARLAQVAVERAVGEVLWP